MGGLFDTSAQDTASSIAKQQNQAAKTYQGSAASQYGQLGSQGQNLFNVGQNNLYPLLGQFAQSAGVGFQPNTFGGAGAGGGAAGTLNTASLQPGGGGAIQGQAAGSTPAGIVGGRPGVANGGQQVQQGQQGGYNPTDPYALLPYQAQQLNQLTANIRQTGQQAIASFQQQMATSGITDPRALQAGTQQIAEHFNAQQSEEVAKFYEDARKSKEQALQSLIQQFQQIGQQGLSAQEVAAGGTAGLAGSAAGTAISQAGLAQQAQAASTDQFIGLLSPFTYGLSRLLSPSGVTQPSAPVNYDPYLNAAGVTNADLGLVPTDLASPALNAPVDATPFLSPDYFSGIGY